MLKLTIQGLGPVPSFKNSKQIAINRKTGKPFIMSDPKKKRWMESAIAQLVSQLRGLYPTSEGAMLGECLRPLPTALSQLLDDSLGYMIPGQQGVRVVEKGNEGAEIEIE